MKPTLFHRQTLQRTLARLGLGGLAGMPLAAGCTDQVTAPPLVPEGPTFGQASSVAASQLVIVQGLGVDPAKLGVTVSLNVNRGILAASRTGEADFVLNFRLKAEQGNRVGGFSPKGEPLNGVKTTGALHPKFEAFTTVVPWDFRDDSGEPISGPATVNYEIDVRRTVDGKVIELGTVSGSTDLVLPDPDPVVQ